MPHHLDQISAVRRQGQAHRAMAIRPRRLSRACPESRAENRSGRSWSTAQRPPGLKCHRSAARSSTGGCDPGRHRPAHAPAYPAVPISNQGGWVTAAPGGGAGRRGSSRCANVTGSRNWRRAGFALFKGASSAGVTGRVRLGLLCRLGDSFGQPSESHCHHCRPLIEAAWPCTRCHHGSGSSRSGRSCGRFCRLRASLSNAPTSVDALRRA